MKDLYSRIQEAKAYVHAKWTGQVPKLALVLGTGMGDFVDHLDVQLEIPFRAIPHFAATSVIGHKGKLIFANRGDVTVLIVQGRYHYYEGFDMATVTLPIRLVQAMGIPDLVMTNASGGLQAAYDKGDLAIITDHINLHHENPLRGSNDERLGIRFPDMKDAYAPHMREALLSIAKSLDISVHESVYAGLPGPNLETPAEYRYLHRIGADLVGMSTVPEAIVARHAGLNLAALSVISNVCYPPERIVPTTVEDVIKAVQSTAQSLSHLLLAFIDKYQ